MTSTRTVRRSLVVLALLAVVLAGSIPAFGAPGDRAPGRAAIDGARVDGGSLVGDDAPASGAADVLTGSAASAPSALAPDSPAGRVGTWTDRSVDVGGPILPFDGWTDQTTPTLPPGVLVAVAGYSRWDDSDPLEHDTRRRVYEAVRDRPGTHVAAIVDATDVPRGTVRYHLRILAGEHLVVSESVRGKRRYAPAGDDVRLEAALADGPARTILEAVARLEPVTVGSVADEVDRATSTVSHHLDGLAEDGLVDRETDGRNTLVTLTPRSRGTIDGHGESGTGRATAGIGGE